MDEKKFMQQIPAVWSGGFVVVIVIIRVKVMI